MSVQGTKLDPVPSVQYLKNLLSAVSRVNNGRHIHAVNNCRQMLSSYIALLEKGVTLDERMTGMLSDTVAKTKHLMYSVWCYKKPDKRTSALIQ
jgi:hypothetical protein